MANLTKEELDRLFNQPMYTWDINTMLSGVVDYLEFSEKNLSWQRRREMKYAKEEGDKAIFEEKDAHLAPSYRSQLIEAVEYRFDVTLSQTVRYGGLTAFITTIELCAETFYKNLNKNYPKAPKGENKNVYLLTKLIADCGANYNNEIEDIKNLVYVRHCVAHAAGLLDRYKFKDQIIDIIETLDGFSVWNDNYLGSSVHIDIGSVEKYAEHATLWVPDLYEQCVNNNLVKLSH